MAKMTTDGMPIVTIRVKHDGPLSASEVAVMDAADSWNRLVRGNSTLGVSHRRGTFVLDKRWTRAAKRLRDAVDTLRSQEDGG